MDTLQFIINILMGMSLSDWFNVGIVLGLLVFAPLEVWLHEFGHLIAIHKARESTPLYVGTLQIKITHSNKWVTRQGYTASPYLRFLAKEPLCYKKQIRTIAKAGVQFSSTVSLIICFLFLIPALLISSKLACLLISISGIGFGLLIRSQIGYLLADGEMCDKKIVKHPEKYIYNETPSWDGK